MAVKRANELIRGVYAITPVTGDKWCWHDVMECSGALLDGGVGLMQFRQKSLSPADWAQKARELGRLCESFGATLILNDAPPEVALPDWPAVRGVHLGRSDMPVSAARQLWGTEILIGASCYNQASMASKAVSDGADHVAFGALYPSSTKPEAVRAELTLFAQSAGLGVPSVGIGGIELDRLPELALAGVSAVAVVSAIYGASPDASACRKRALAWVQEWERLQPDAAASKV